MPEYGRTLADRWNIPVRAEDAGSDEARFWPIDVGHGRGRRRGRIGPQAENCRLCGQPVVITDGASRISVDIVALGIGLRAGKTRHASNRCRPKWRGEGQSPEDQASSARGSRTPSANGLIGSPSRRGNNPIGRTSSAFIDRALPISFGPGQSLSGCESTVSASSSLLAPFSKPEKHADCHDNASRAQGREKARISPPKRRLGNIVRIDSNSPPT
jgi:hypothetical protein